MQNSIVMFTFSFLTGNTIFGPKIQNCQFKLKFGTYTNSNVQILIVMFTFSVFTGNTLWGNLVQKIKIVNLS